MNELKKLGDELIQVSNEYANEPYSIMYPEWDKVRIIGQRLIELSEPQLNENQQIVLDWLKNKCDPDAFIKYSPFEVFHLLEQPVGLGFSELKVREAICTLSTKEEAQVLQTFSQWVLNFAQEEYEQEMTDEGGERRWQLRP